MTTSEQVRIRSRQDVLRFADCEHCSLSGPTKHPHPVFGRGSKDAEIIFIGLYPVASEIRTGDVFSGESGALLFQTLKDLHVAPQQVWLDNALLCPQRDKKPGTKEVDACRVRLITMLEQLHKRKVIVCMGQLAAQALRGTSHETAEQLNGRVEHHALLGCDVVYTYHPVYVLYRPDVYPDYQYAMRRAVEVLRGEYDPEAHQAVETEYVVVDEVEPCAKTLYALLDEADAAGGAGERLTFACDIETEGLALDAPILEVGLSFSEHTAYVIREQVLQDASIRALLDNLFDHEAIQWVWHNGKFDVQHLRQEFGVRARIDADTMLMHYSLDERASGTTDAFGAVTQHGGGHHDLKTLSHRYCGAPEWSDEVEAIIKKPNATMRDVPLEMRNKYHAYDCDYTRRLYFVLADLLEQEPPSKIDAPMPREMHDKLLVPAANALADIEARGIGIDIDRLVTLREHFDGLLREADNRACYEAEPYTYTCDEPFSPSSPLQVARVVYDHLKYPPMGSDRFAPRSTEEPVLLAIRARGKQEGTHVDASFIDAVLDFRGYQKIIRTYLEGISTRMNMRTRRINTSFLLHGTVTGRLSSRSPNLQNIPKGSVLKEMFVPAEGMTLLESDYAQLEIRTCALLSGCEQMREDVYSGDVHWQTAQSVFKPTIAAMNEARDVGDLDELVFATHALRSVASRQRDPSTRRTDFAALYGDMKEQLRRHAKFINFGVMFGRGAESMANPDTGMGVPILEAERFIHEWRRRYQEAYMFLREQVATARKERFIESWAGRRRRFPFMDRDGEAANEALNFPIQSLASDICLMSLIRLHEALEARQLGHVLLTVHDALICELVTERLAEAAALVYETMTSALANDFILFDVDMKAGANWGNLHKLDLRKAS